MKSLQYDIRDQLSAVVGTQVFDMMTIKVRIEVWPLRAIGHFYDVRHQLEAELIIGCEFSGDKLIPKQ